MRLCLQVSDICGELCHVAEHDFSDILVVCAVTECIVYTMSNAHAFYELALASLR